MWFVRKRKRPQLLVLEEEILASVGDFPKGLKKKLQRLDFVHSWQLTKKVLPQIEKTQTRSLVRLLFADKTAEIVEKTKDKAEINHALSCLEYLPSREAVEALVELLEHRDETIQLITAGVLKNHTPRLVVPCLINKLLNCEIPPARAGEVLLSMGYLAQDALLEAYEVAKPQVQAQILELLTISQNPKCDAFLSSALQSEEQVLRKAALEAVSLFLTRDLWPDVVLCLTDSAWPIRAKALEVLTKLRVVEALENVRPLLEDEDPWVRKGAVAFFKVLGQEIA